MQKALKVLIVVVGSAVGIFVLGFFCSLGFKLIDCLDKSIVGQIVNCAITSMGLTWFFVAGLMKYATDTNSQPDLLP